MIINQIPLEELKRIYSEVLFSRTNKVTKVTPGSVVNSVAFANSKLAQKVLANITVSFSRFFPSTAYGSNLDSIASSIGINSRLGALGSSTYVRLVGIPGTVYTQNSTISGIQGITFNLDQEVTIGPSGFGYGLVSSLSVGESTNVDPFDLNDITPVPDGHEFITNEYAAFGGRDAEDDDSFRDRIKNFITLTARGTLSYLEQVFISINPKVLRVFNNGIQSDGKLQLLILTQNGSSLSSSELETLTNSSASYFSLNEMNPNGLNGLGFKLENVTYQPIDVSLRVRVNPDYSPVEVRKNMQVRMNKYMDYRFWTIGSRVEWDDLLVIAKTTEGIDYLIDSFFYPDFDVEVEFPFIPRLRGFLMLDEDGNTITDGTENFNPVFYPNVPDFGLFANVLSNL